MSDYNFLFGPAVNQSFSATVSNNTITLSSGSFDVGDVIYLPHSNVYGVYAYCIDGAVRRFKFDDEIYTNVPASINTSKGKYWEVGDVIYDDVNSYRIGSQVEKGLYSNSYITYKTSIDYTLLINSKRREFFTSTANKSVKALVLENDIVFSDSCSEFAYGVGFAGEDFDTFNNKFKSSLEFNIATR